MHISKQPNKKSPKRNSFAWQLLAWAVAALTVSGGMLSCSNSTDPPPPVYARSTRATETPNGAWTRVEMKTPGLTGVVVPHVIARMDNNHRVHTAYFYGTSSSVDNYTVQYFSFDLNSLTSGATESVQTLLDNCQTLALAISGSNAPLISYQGGNPQICGDENQSDVMISARSGGNWTEYTGEIGYIPPERNPVINDGLIGHNIAMEFDANGAVHLAYQYFYEGCDHFGNTYPDLRYIRKNAGSLGADVTEETVEGNAFNNGMATVQNIIGGHVRMLIINGDEPVVFYYASVVTSDVYGLRMAHRTGGEWVKEWVDQSVIVGAISCALTPSGDLAVAYYVDNTEVDGRQFLKYAVNIDSAWYVRTVDESSLCGDYCSLAFNGDGQPVIAYYDMMANSGSSEHRDLKIARLNSGVWEKEYVATEGDIGLYNTLWFDENGTGYICSYSASDRTIYLFYE